LINFFISFYVKKRKEKKKAIKKTHFSPLEVARLGLVRKLFDFKAFIELFQNNNNNNNLILKKYTFNVLAIYFLKSLNIKLSNYYLF
jgi:hypothetical protein